MSGNNYEDKKFQDFQKELEETREELKKDYDFIVQTIIELTIEDFPFPKPIYEFCASVIEILEIRKETFNQLYPPYTLDMEAFAFTAFCVRNTSIVENKLHAEEQPLTDELMPEFTGVIAANCFTLLKCKEALEKNEFRELWEKFVRYYAGDFCKGWEYHRDDSGVGNNKSRM